MRKKICIFLLITILCLQCFLLTSCVVCTPIMVHTMTIPTDQVNSKWQTDDGSFVFYVTSNNQIYGKINTGDNIEFVELSSFREIVYIHTIPYFDGYDSDMNWDKIQRNSASSQYVISIGDKYSIKRSLFTPKIEFSAFEESNLNLKKNFTVTRVAENLDPEEIELPPVNLPEYYYLYEKYKDVFDLKIELFSEFESIYGKCELATYHEATIDGRIKYVIDSYYYIADVDEENRPTYYIQLEQTNDHIYGPSLISAEMLPTDTIRLEN